MREYVLVFLTALAVTYLLAVPARELATRFGAVARVRDRDVHDIPIPYFGGVAMMGGLTAAVLVARQLPSLGHSPLNDLIFADARAILIGGAAMCLVGVADDIFELDAVTKLAGEVLAAGVVVVQGLQFTWLPYPGPGGRTFAMFTLGGSQAALITILVIVGTVNAVNFVDGLDGLAAGVIGIGAVAFFSFSVALVLINDTELATTAAMLAAALAGACFGFLPHNFFPARMFMGDSGALLIGFMLASSAISLTGQFTTSTLNQGTGLLPALPTLLPLILPFAVLLVPFADLMLAVVRRTRAGRSPFAPDKKHLHHRLLEIGHSQRRAVLVMYLWSGLVAFGVVLVSLFSGWWSAAGLGVMAVTASLLTFGVPGHSGLISSEEA